MRDELVDVVLVVISEDLLTQVDELETGRRGCLLRLRLFLYKHLGHWQGLLNDLRLHHFLCHGRMGSDARADGFRYIATRPHLRLLLLERLLPTALAIGRRRTLLAPIDGLLRGRWLTQLLGQGSIVLVQDLLEDDELRMAKLFPDGLVSVLKAFVAERLHAGDDDYRDVPMATVVLDDVAKSLADGSILDVSGRRVSLEALALPNKDVENLERGNLEFLLADIVMHLVDDVDELGQQEIDAESLPS